MNFHQQSPNSINLNQPLTQDLIIGFQNTLSRTNGINIKMQHHNNQQIVLRCDNHEINGCQWKYHFRKCMEAFTTTIDYQLEHCYKYHNYQCQCTQRNKLIFPTSQSAFKTYNIQSIVNADENTSTIIQPDKLYTEGMDKTRLFLDEISSLKKQLQYQSKGYISKSTQYHQQSGYVTKIFFKCKTNLSCPYLSTLIYTYQRNHDNQKLYKLNKTDEQHLSICLLNQEEINYNIIRRKIDKNQHILKNIIEKHHQLDLKPKTILKEFAQQLQQINQFIYEGLKSRSKKRAVKKYFDNSVAKVRKNLKQKI